MSAIMSSRLAAELDHAFERNGWSAEEVKFLSRGKLLAEVRRVVLGNAEIQITKHIIDCDAAPFVPKGWAVEEHQEGGQFNFKELLVQLSLIEGQQTGTLEGNDIRKELAMELPDKLSLNANVLDYLLAHSEIIPGYWKGKDVFFWGTVYKDSEGDLCVRYLTRYDSKWDWNYRWLGSEWGSKLFAAMRIG